MNIKKSLGRIVSVLLVAMMVAFIPANSVYAWDLGSLNLFGNKNANFSVSMKAGYADKLYVGFGAPFYITVTNNNSTNFDGNIQMIVPNYNDENIMYEQEFTIGAGEKKTVEFNASYPVPGLEINVRITDKKGNVIWSEIQNVTYNKRMNEVRVGVLSDDYTALAYMDRQHFLSENTIFTSLVELDKDTLSEDYQSMETIDVIVISDFSTDLLTKEQVGALNLWVQNGGLLIVGTGSTGNKTLSGINGKIFNASLVEKGDKETTLGQANRNRDYLLLIGSTKSSSSERDSYLYDIFYNEYYNYDINDYSSLFYDEDGDGYSDTVSMGYMWTYNNNNIVDTNGQVIASDYNYLFEDGAFSQDPISGAFHYKYYDERYCVVPDDSDFYYYFSNWDTSDLYDKNMYVEYCRVWGFDPKYYLYEYFGYKTEADLEKAFNDYFGDDYLEFKKHWMYGYYIYVYENLDPFTDLTQTVNTQTIYQYNNIVVDTTTYSVDGTIDTVIGDTSTGEEFELGSVVARGKGYIIVCAVDFTKNPIPKTSYAGDFFRDMVEQYIGQSFIVKANEYESNYNSSYGSYYNSYGSNTVSSLINAVCAAPIPPFILYAIIILLYLVGMIVLYIVFSTKKKTYSLWKIYPAMMVLLGIFIFCLGFSTRMLRLNVNIISIIKPDNGITSETDYIAAVIPKDKQYSVKFSNDVKLDKSFDGEKTGYMSYYPNEEHNMNKYALTYRENYDSVEGVIDNKPALSNQIFKTDSVYLTQGGLELSFVANPSIVGIDASSIRVTNNYATDVEDVIVAIFDKNDKVVYYFIDKIKAGESKLVSEGKNYSEGKFEYKSSYDGYGIRDKFNTYKTGTAVLGFFTGELNPDFRKYLKRRAAIEYIMRNEVVTDDDHLTVIAFPKTTVGATVTDQKNCKINRYEMIVVNPSYSDMQITTLSGN